MMAREKSRPVINMTHQKKESSDGESYEENEMFSDEGYKDLHLYKMSNSI